MAKIDHQAKTVSTVCQADDEAKVRVSLQEILDDNPGYTPVLIVEDASGEEKTYTTLETPRRRRSAPAVESTPVLSEMSLEDLGNLIGTTQGEPGTEITDQESDPDYFEDDDE
jgi:hypothetical protein